jgi:hypothetical protein
MNSRISIFSYKNFYARNKFSRFTPLVLIFAVILTLIVAIAASNASETNCAGAEFLQNGSFEKLENYTDIFGNTYAKPQDWKTTAADGYFDIWRNLTPDITNSQIWDQSSASSVSGGNILEIVGNPTNLDWVPDGNYGFDGYPYLIDSNQNRIYFYYDGATLYLNYYYDQYNRQYWQDENGHWQFFEESIGQYIYKNESGDWGFYDWGLGEFIPTPTLQGVDLGTYSQTFHFGPLSGGGPLQGIYQDVNTVPGTTIKWSYWHHFTSGSPQYNDITLNIGAPPLNIPSGNFWTLNEQSSPFGDLTTETFTHRAVVNTAWEKVSGTYVVPDGQYKTRFLFQTSTDANDGVGNLIDNVEVTPLLACTASKKFVSSGLKSFKFTSNAADSSNFDYIASSDATLTIPVGQQGSPVATLNADGSYQIEINTTDIGTYSIDYEISDSGITSSGKILVEVVAPAVNSCDNSAGNITDYTLNNGTERVIVYKLQSNAQSADCTFEVPENVFSIDYLVVAGGGGGASGGGGAGGMVTSWQTRNESGRLISKKQTPYGVRPFDTLQVHVGKGGAAGSGGNYGDWQQDYGHSISVESMPKAQSGDDSYLGDIKAKGGGYGGWGAGINGVSQSGGSGGSGGGGSFDFTGTSTSSADRSKVIGAAPLGNAGGFASGYGGYRGGSGGGGAGSVGKGPGNLHLGGHGGDGALTDIEGNGLVEYACGGGGGVNENNFGNIYEYYDSTIDANRTAGGDGGCATAGDGSDWGSELRTGGDNHFDGGSSAVDNFGGGGGGTDPESTVAGRGGSGIVIIRYTIPSGDLLTYCPYDEANPPAQLPLACPLHVTITAGESAYQIPQGYYVDNATVVSLPVSISGLNATVSGQVIQISAPKLLNGELNPLIGSSFPLTYQLTSGTTSINQIIIAIRDPDQHTPIVAPIDPRATYIDLPLIETGNISVVQACISLENVPSYNSDLTFQYLGEATGALNVSSISGGIKLSGTSAELADALTKIRLTKSPSENSVIPGNFSRILKVNISNPLSGGNGSCTAGTSSEIEIKPYGITQTVRKGIIQLK